MQYNGEANNQDIFTCIDDLVETDDNQFTLERKARAVNKTLKTIWTWIFESYGGWQYDDSGHSDLPSAVDTLTASKVSYALPSDAIAVRGIEVKDENGIWFKLRPITQREIQEVDALGEFNNVAGFPEYYEMVGETVKIYPAANWTQASSFKVFFDRGVVEIVPAETTDTPGFASVFHEAVAVGAALEYAKVNRQDLVPILFQDWQDYERRIKSFYSQRFKEALPNRFKVRDSVIDVL